jgi:hypothetical protein
LTRTSTFSKSEGREDLRYYEAFTKNKDFLRPIDVEDDN